MRPSYEVLPLGNSAADYQPKSWTYHVAWLLIRLTFETSAGSAKLLTSAKLLLDSTQVLLDENSPRVAHAISLINDIETGKKTIYSAIHPSSHELDGNQQEMNRINRMRLIEFIDALETRMLASPGTAQLTPTALVRQALEIVFEVHKDEVRKAEKPPQPFVVHPLYVAELLASLSADEELKVAGLLHDTVESGGITLEALTTTFGPIIARLVAAVTENEDVKSLPHRLRKTRTLDKLKDCPDDRAILLKLTDAVHNCETMTASFKHQGETVWKKFNLSLEDRIWYFEEIVQIGKEKMRATRERCKTEPSYIDTPRVRENYHILTTLTFRLENAVEEMRRVAKRIEIGRKLSGRT